MASIIPVNEYDICLRQGYGRQVFISYRHKDNRSGSVTEFVTIFQEELASIIKKIVSCRHQLSDRHLIIK